MLPAQQGDPRVPQAWHDDIPLAVTQAVPMLQVPPAQQAWPIDPQAPQRPPAHVRVAPAQVLAAQQGWPDIPQAAHMPPEHTDVGLSQRAPPQHG